MTDPERPSRTDRPAPAAVAPVIPLHPRAEPLAPLPEPDVRIKKLRVLLLLAGLGALALVSTLFGMMMAVASELPALEDPPVKNSVMVDARGKRIGLLTGREQRIFVDSADIAPVMKQAIIAIEDRRFYTHDGVDLRGVGRALWQDVVQRRIVQGGSTITQQFVKNATAAQEQRTIFNKVREAALAFHLTRKWSKERILRNYLNTIYFGNGAYGIESAARTYFGSAHPGCGERGEPACASVLDLHEAALIAAVVASPSGYDPLAHPEAARQRRDVVLRNMVDQRYISEGQFVEAVAEALPTRADVSPPTEDTRHPYFTSWVKQQVVDRLGGGQAGARQAFEGGLVVETTLDSELQTAAENAVRQWLPDPTGPRAALVAIDNATGGVRAMVGGDDYASSPFNIATQGQRQPGSAFKPFILAEALRQGISPDSQWSSRKRDFCLSRKGGACVDAFKVNNYEDAYAGTRTLRTATTFSDNAVYAEVGLKVRTKRVARLARRMGIRTPVSSNAAMTLGGLRRGVTPLDMAHAYQTFASGGKLVYGTLSPGADSRRRIPVPGPVAIREIRREGEPVELPDGGEAKNRKRTRRVLPESVARRVEEMLGTVVTQGTATRAALSDEFVAGKTGTTENYGDAWFVGWTKAYTVAVWVGYPDRLKYMKTEFRGDPVAGGTYPAGIWKSFMERLLELRPGARSKKKPEAAPPVPDAGAPAPAPAPAPGTPQPAAPAPAPEGTAEGGGGGGGGVQGAGEGAPQPEAIPQSPPVQDEPAQDPAAAPPPAPPPAGEPGGAAPPPGE